MTPIQDRVQVLQFRFKNHSDQTNGFAWDYTAAKDEDVLETTHVFQDTLDGLSDTILKIVKPGQRRKLKKQILYLTGLRHRQAEVWEKYIEDCQNRTNNVNQWVLQNQP